MAAGCAKTGPSAVVHARLGLGHALAGLEIDAVPFDPDRVLDSLAAVAPRAQPQFPTLISTLLAYHRPRPGSGLTGPVAEWLATRDSARIMADSLRGVGRRSPGYAAAFERFRGLYQRSVERQRASDGGRVSIPEADRRLADRAASAADSLRAWEDVAYAAYPAIAESLQGRTGRHALRAMTDSAGNSTLALAPGGWWLLATLPDTGNPFAERSWRIPVVASRGRILVIPIFEGNYTLRWRH
ncbi:MAG TPA: hypothetical protein VGI83_00520 [Gemmatimonadales bacterium]